MFRIPTRIFSAESALILCPAFLHLHLKHWWAQGGDPPKPQGSGENQTRGSGRNGIEGPRRQKIGRMGVRRSAEGPGVKLKCSYRVFIREVI